MQLKLLTLRFDPSLGRFPEDPLSEIEGEVVSAVEHFFHHEGIPHLLDPRSFARFCGAIDEVGRMIGGWIKGQAPLQEQAGS